MEIIRREIEEAENRIEQQIGRRIRLKERSKKEELTADNGDMYVIMAVVAEALGMTMDDYSEGRQPKYVDLRTIATMFIKKEFPKTPLAKIAERFGLLDHTTIINHLQRGDRMLFTKDKEFCPKYKAAADAINNRKKNNNAKREDSDMPGIEVGTDGRGGKYNEGMAAGITGAGRAVYQ